MKIDCFGDPTEFESVLGKTVDLSDVRYHLIAWNSHRTLSDGECITALMQLGMAQFEASKMMMEWRNRL